MLDETDSGLDIDALKVVANGVNSLRSPERAMVLVTHYQRLLDYIVPDFVHVLAGGRIVRTGERELALELEAARLRLAARGGGRGMSGATAVKREQAPALPEGSNTPPPPRPVPTGCSSGARRPWLLSARSDSRPARRGLEVHRPHARCDAALAYR